MCSTPEPPPPDIVLPSSSSSDAAPSKEASSVLPSSTDQSIEVLDVTTAKVEVPKPTAAVAITEQVTEVRKQRIVVRKEQFAVATGIGSFDNAIVGGGVQGQDPTQKSGINSNISYTDSRKDALLLSTCLCSRARHSV